MQLKMLNQINKLLFKPRAPLLGFAMTYVQVIKVTMWVMHLMGNMHISWQHRSSLQILKWISVCARVCAVYVCLCVCLCVTRAGRWMHACVYACLHVWRAHTSSLAHALTISTTHIFTWGFFPFLTACTVPTDITYTQSVKQWKSPPFLASHSISPPSPPNHQAPAPLTSSKHR